MPEIARFGGFKILMFFHDENPPHVHVVGPGFAAKLRIASGEVLAGAAPGKVLKHARRWLDRHRRDAMSMWQEFQR